MTIRSTYTLIQQINQGSFHLAKRYRLAVHHIVGVYYPHHVFELIHPRFGCEWCFEPSQINIQVSDVAGPSTKEQGKVPIQMFRFFQNANIRQLVRDQRGQIADRENAVKFWVESV